MNQVEGPSNLLGWMPQPEQFPQHPSGLGWQAGDWDDPKCGSCQGIEWGIPGHYKAQLSIPWHWWKWKKWGSLPQTERERCFDVQRDSRAIPFLKGWGAQDGTGIILEALLTSSFAITDQLALTMGQDSGDDVSLHIMSGEVLRWDAIVHAAGLEYL